MDFTTIIQNIGMFAVGSGVIAILVKSLINSSLNRELERFKYDLNKKSEEFKTELQIFSSEHQIRFLKLHNDRAAVIQELYLRLRKMEKAMKSYMAPAKLIGDTPLDEKAKLAAESANEFINYADENKLFLSKYLYTHIDVIIEYFKDAWHDYAIHPIEDDPQIEKTLSNEYKEIRTQSRSRARKTLNEDIPKIKEKIEDEFRSLLGVRPVE